MKRAILAAAALLSSTIISTPTFATTYAPSADPPTTADMQAVCDGLDTDGAGTDYQVILTEGTVDYGDPTNDLSTVTDDETTRVANHSSPSSPFGSPSYYGNAGRHGGSVNLFATVGYPGITYAGSFVDQNVDRTETDTYNFSCQLQHWAVVGSHSVPGDGHYVVDPDAQGNEEAHQHECDAYNNAHYNHEAEQGFWGDTPKGNCKFEGSLDTTVDDYDWVNSGSPTPETLTDGPYFVDNVVYATHVSEPSVPVTETDAAPYFAGDGVVCINPGKKGGTWTAKAGWTKPLQCTTLYFNTAPYISGAQVFSSNSLPPL